MINLKLYEIQKKRKNQMHEEEINKKNAKGPPVLFMMGSL